MLIDMGYKEDLDALEHNIQALKTAYDMYFQGFEKRPPDKLREDTERMVRHFATIQVPNTGLRYRANSLVQRMTSYRQMWDRILRQIEEGTYKRDIYRANLKQKYASTPAGQRDEIIEDAEVFEDSSQKWGGVFEQYVKARQSTQEGAKGITYDKLHSLLEKQAEQIKQKYGAKDVQFRVVVENGKTRLKATPKK